MKLKLTLIMSGILAVSGCGGEDKGKTLPSTTLPNTTITVADDPVAGITDSSAYNDYGVHDPSVIKADGAYYVFGSHLGAAKSIDLMGWTDVSNIVDGDINTSTLFDTYNEEVAEGIAWNDGYTGSWASDVIQAPNGKYWFYYNHCANTEADGGCWNRSHMGLAESDNVEGPYVNKGVFLRSGYREAAEFDAYPVYDPATDSYLTAWNGAIHPNAIDPAAYYDKDGNLWMTYGSYSGGIFVLAMDEATGMPEANQGYGTHIVGGDFSAIEGSFVLYSEESDYYYLFWSNGGFNAADGYNIRVARSRTPDGPFLDALGNDMVNARVENDMGVKLMGGYNFASALGDTSAEWGYRSPGHNSALYDAELGKYLMFTHTRFPLDQVPFEQYHAVRIHEMWLNDDDWLVSSPHRYGPITGDNVVDYKDLSGDYRIVLHGNDTNTDVHESLYVTFTEQGRFVEGQLSGSYKLYADTDRIHVIIDGDTYKGVMKWQWNAEDERLEPTISAMNSAGEALWAHKLEDKTQSEVVADIIEAISIPATIKSGQLELPEMGARGAELRWTSSDTGFIENDGTITRPNTLDGDQDVSITVEVMMGGEVAATDSYTVHLPARVTYNRTAYYEFEDNLTDSLTNFADGIPAVNVAGDPATAAYTGGQVGQALNMDGTFGVLLPNDLIDGYKYTVSFWLNEQVSTNFRPAFFAAHSQSPERWVSFLPGGWNGELMVWSRWDDDDGNVAWHDTFTGLVYPDAEWHHVAFSVDSGSVVAFYDGVQIGVGNNLKDFFTESPEGTIITLGLNYWDDAPQFQIDELKVYEEALTAQEVSALDVNPVPDSELIDIAAEALTFEGLDYVVKDLELPNSGPFAAAVTWSSSDTSVLTDDGVVSRPPRGSENAQLVLTATITLGSDSAIKEFAVTVPANNPPVAVARYSFEGDLTDATANFGDGYAAVRGDAEIPASDTSESYGTGIVGDALSMSGEGSVGVRFDQGLISSYNYSISFWVNPNTLTVHTPSFAGFGNDTAFAANWMNFVLSAWWSEESALWIENSGQSQHDFGMVTPVGEWTHIVLSVTQGEDKIWVNSQLVHEGTDVPDLYSADDSRFFTVGLNWWDIPYNGLFDELVIFADPIAQEDVDLLFAEGAQE